MSSGRDCDVLVVGCGPVGATVAALLGNAGLRTIVIDREPTYYPLPRAVVADDDSLRVWETVPGLVEVLSEGMITGARVRYAGLGRRTFMLGDSALHRTTSGHPMMGLFHQPTLEGQLRARLSEIPHVEMRLGVECTRFEQDDEGVTATLATASGTQAIRAGWLLACDGAGSGIRSQLGIGFSGDTFVQKWVVADVFTDDPGTERPEVEFSCDPARPTVTMPMPGGRRRWEFMLMPGDDEESIVAPDRLGELIRGAGWASEWEVERAVVYTFHARVADRWRDGRVFLLGDAAHITPPFIGQGMNSGIRDAGNIWWKIAGVEAGTLSESVLDTYEIERRGHVRKMIDMAVRLGGIIQTVDLRTARVRDMVLRLLTGLPMLSRWTRELKWRPVSIVPRGFVSGGKRRLGSRVGTQAPRPEVVTADGRKSLLDELIGPGWAVLSTRPDPLTEMDADTGRLATEVGAAVVQVGGPNGVHDPSLQLDTWLRSAGGTVLVRPDRFVYATAG